MFDNSKVGKSQNVAGISLSLTLLLKSTIILKKKITCALRLHFLISQNMFNNAISNHTKLLILWLYDGQISSVS